MGIEIFELMKNHNQEQVAFYTDKTVQLRALLAIHNTTLGPAIGGVRIFKYKTLDEALNDLIRLSEAMTYKAAGSGINFGGGSLLVIDQPGMEKNEPFFRALGRFIESFHGRFLAAEDIGMTDDAMEYMAMESDYITGLPYAFSNIGGHSHMCSYGTYIGLKAAAKYAWGSDDISRKKIIIQGYGRIGSRLAELTMKEGAYVVVSDTNEERAHQAKKDGFAILPPDKVFSEKCHILSPCAVGPVVTRENIEIFQCEIIAGSSNIQLGNEDDDYILKKKNIVYAPDFIINSGAVINISVERIGGYNKEKVRHKIENIYDRLLSIYKYADDNDISPNQAAIRYALQRIESFKEIKGAYLGRKHFK